MSWSASDTSNCYASDDWSGNKTTPSGSETMWSLVSSHKYTLTCANNFGTSSDSVIVNVTQPVCGPDLQPTININGGLTAVTATGEVMTTIANNNTTKTNYYRDYVDVPSGWDYTFTDWNSGADETYFSLPKSSSNLYRLHLIPPAGTTGQTKVTLHVIDTNDSACNYSIDIYWTPPSVYHKITSVIEGNGILTPPAGVISVVDNGLQKYYFSPQGGSHLLHVYQDGQDYGATYYDYIDRIWKYYDTWTFNNVTTDHTLKVVYSVPQVTVCAYVMSGGGTGTITSPQCQSVNPNTDLTVNFSPGAGYVFDNSQIVNPNDSTKTTAQTGGNPTSYTFTGVKRDWLLYVYFKLIPNSKILNIGIQGPFGGNDPNFGKETVVSSPVGINCTDGGGGNCQAAFAAGTVVTLTANPVAGFTSFADWRGSGASGSNPNYTFTMDSDKTIVADFSLIAPTVSLTASPTTITATGSGPWTSRLTWSSTNATSCTATSGAGFATGGVANGYQDVSYTSVDVYVNAISCTGPGGAVSGYVTVNVNALAQVPPSVTTLPVTGALTENSAEIRGRVDSVGSTPLVEHSLYIGTDPACLSGTKKYSKPILVNGGAETISQLATGLKPSTIYYYNIYAENSNASSKSNFGQCLSFLTKSAQPTPVSAKRTVKVIVSWQENGQTVTQEFKTFL